MEALKFEIYKKDDCANSSRKKHGPGYRVKCLFMNESREMEILFEDHKYLTEVIGVSTSDLLGELFRELPNVSEINDDFTKLFGESMDKSFKKATEEINKLVKDYYV